MRSATHVHPRAGATRVRDDETDGHVQLATFENATLGDPKADQCILTGLESVQLANYDAGDVDTLVSLTFFLDVPRSMFEMAVQPFDLYDQGDPVNRMWATDLQSDQREVDTRGLETAPALRTSNRPQ